MRTSSTMSEQTTVSSNAEWLKPRDVAEEFGISLSTVYRWSYQGVGPQAHKIGGLRYRRSDVDAWAAEQAKTAGSTA